MESREREDRPDGEFVESEAERVGRTGRPPRALAGIDGITGPRL